MANTALQVFKKIKLKGFQDSMQITSQPRFGGSFLVGASHQPKKVHKALMAERGHDGYTTTYTDDYQLMPRRMIIVPNQGNLYDGYVARRLNQAGISYSYTPLGPEYWLEKLKLEVQPVTPSPVVLGYPLASSPPASAISHREAHGNIALYIVWYFILDEIKRCWGGASSVKP